MITARTKTQLIVFALITMIGVAFVGARYARLDRLFLTTDYKVTAQFPDSGGIFTGAEVTYRGDRIGQVTALELTKKGVDVVLSIDKGDDTIPADTVAQVGNKSAVGEQYVDLQPRTDSKPYLKDKSVIPSKDTEIPTSTVALLDSVDGLVKSVPKDDLKTTVDELGTAFAGTGRSLGQIIDTSNAFIGEANANFDVTTALIRDADTVLGTQIDKTSALQNFSRNLELFSNTLADSDPDLRKVIDNGGATADQLRTFLEQNEVELNRLLSNVATTGQVFVKHLKGLRQLLVIYPYVVEGSYSVLAKTDLDSEGTSGQQYNAQFGLVLTQGPVCYNGYQTERRKPDGGYNDPDGRADIPMNDKVRCADKPSVSNARGSQNAPEGRAATSYRAPVVATYDQGTGKVDWTDRAPGSDVTYSGGAAKTLGTKDSWKWLLLSPVAADQE
ncbi:ABC transporter substrate-binding protein [Marmoricola endophyticus]|uniref:ABC transporter substrate-binding protein n=1 Tax=Marmoricola endophyticus TaxID=2040280 RepID=A0A917F2X5_9ACTN|nr:MlaD family protein [Marmoricola endophyticus]GGF43293.1 ABC transporter substrate-binding protein [Marmoricola endophyticus]